MSVTTLNKITTVYGLASQLMKEHGLTDQGWTFDFDNAKTRVGQCRYSKKEIGFSIAYIEKTPIEDIRNTILHEIAHALVGPNHGHDYTWKRKCVEIGARPERLASERSQTDHNYNYVMECPNCGHKWYRYRMRQRNFGGKCPDCKVVVDIYRLEH